MLKQVFQPVHAKVFCWYKDQKPKIAFVGSSNYTKNGFVLSQVEYLTPVNNGELQEVDAFINEVRKNSKGCKANDISKFVAIHDLAKSKLKSPRFKDIRFKIYFSRVFWIIKGRFQIKID